MFLVPACCWCLQRGADGPTGVTPIGGGAHCLRRTTEYPPFAAPCPPARGEREGFREPPENLHTVVMEEEELGHGPPYTGLCAAQAAETLQEAQ